MSNGFTYTLEPTSFPGNKVSNLMLNGVATDSTATYRGRVNSFLADGGDNFVVLKEGTNRLGGRWTSTPWSLLCGEQPRSPRARRTASPSCRSAVVTTAEAGTAHGLSPWIFSVGFEPTA